MFVQSHRQQDVEVEKAPETLAFSYSFPMQAAGKASATPEAAVFHNTANDFPDLNAAVRIM